MLKSGFMKACRWVVPAVAGAVFLSACSAGGHHTTDSVLEERFFRHRTEFEKLLKDVQSDDRIEAIQPRRVIYGGGWFNLRDAGSEAAIRKAGLTSQRLFQYEEQLRKLELDGGVMQAHGQVEFRADQGSFLNGDSYKGYVFRVTPPDHILSELDRYRISDRDKTPAGDWIVYRPLVDHWYLCLFVNG
jgi:hypothetical protein